MINVVAFVDQKYVKVFCTILENSGSFLVENPYFADKSGEIVVKIIGPKIWILQANGSWVNFLWNTESSIKPKILMEFKKTKRKMRILKNPVAGGDFI